MSVNQTLCRLRSEKGLSRKDVAKATGIPSLRLYLYEQGYLALPRYLIPCLCQFYQVTPEAFADPLGYPTPCFDNVKKPLPPFVQKAQKIFFSWINWFISLALFLVTVALLIDGGVTLAYANKKLPSFYSEDYVTLVNYVSSHGEESLLGDGKTLTYQPEGTDLFYVETSTSSQGLASTQFQVELTGDASKLTFIYEMSALGFSFKDEDTTEEKTTYQGYGKIENTLYQITALMDGSGNDVSDANALASEQKRMTGCYEKASALFEGFKKDASLTFNSDFHTLLAVEVKGNQTRESMTGWANHLLVIPSLLGVVFFFSTIAILCGILIRKKKQESIPELETVAPESLISENSKMVKTRDFKPLHPNMKVTPFLPETFLRISGIVLMAVSSALLFQLILKFTAADDIFSLLLLADQALSWYQLMPYVAAASLLWFFVRLEILQSEHYNVLPSILMLFCFGVLYYVFDLVLGYYLDQSSDVYHNLLFTVFTQVMPGNLFWGIGCFALIVLFLMTTPTFKNKASLVLWRLLSLLPIGYLAFSYFYAVGTSLWNWPSWPDVFSKLLFRKQFAATFFAIFYPLSIGLYRFIVYRKYGKDQAEMYFHGNRYFFIKNLIACGWIGLICLFCYLAQGTAYLKTMGLSQGYYLAYLIPFILFYHPHLGKRNLVLDEVITLFYVLSLSFAYLYIAKILLIDIPA
jgi:transcriptional regulator with XRE-family HTH domain